MNIQKILKVLVHCVGDCVPCPKCGHVFIPKEKTQDDAFKMYNKISEEVIRVVDRRS